MTIERRENGMWLASDIIGGYLIKMWYMDKPGKRQAAKDLQARAQKYLERSFYNESR